jgi:hypothetical protein
VVVALPLRKRVGCRKKILFEDQAVFLFFWQKLEEAGLLRSDLLGVQGSVSMKQLSYQCWHGTL